MRNRNKVIEKDGGREGKEGRKEKLNCIFDRVHLEGRDANGWTALHHAAYEGHAQAVELLVQAGADINTTDDYVSMTEVV